MHFTRCQKEDTIPARPRNISSLLCPKGMRQASKYPHELQLAAKCAGSTRSFAFSCLPRVSSSVHCSNRYELPVWDWQNNRPIWACQCRYWIVAYLPLTTHCLALSCSCCGTSIRWRWISRVISAIPTRSCADEPIWRRRDKSEKIISAKDLRKTAK